MKMKILTAVSVLALMAPVSAHAFGLGSMASAMVYVSDADNQTVDTTHSTPENIKAVFIGKEARDTLQPVLIKRSMMAAGLIGESVINDDGKKIATVKDIIINKSGKAILIVVSDNGILGIGRKVAAFDYSQTVTQDSDGSVTMALTKDMIDHVADFSYDQKDWAKAKVIPQGSISVNELLKGNVLDSHGKKVASIENVYLRNEDVSQVIVGFDKTLGMGGKLAALDFNDLQTVKKRKDVDFQLTSNQTAQFKSFKQSASN